MKLMIQYKKADSSTDHHLKTPLSNLLKHPDTIHMYSTLAHHIGKQKVLMKKKRGKGIHRLLEIH